MSHILSHRVVTPCECPEPGWCERHQCQKTPHWHLLCRNSQEYFELWELGEGPCLNRLTFGNTEDFRELPRCRHRGGEPQDYVDCRLCGGRSMRVAVYTCNIHGECTERRYGTHTKQAREMRACLRCDDYSAPEDS